MKTNPGWRVLEKGFYPGFIFREISQPHIFRSWCPYFSLLQDFLNCSVIRKRASGDDIFYSQQVQKRMREFFLPTVPVGPFDRNEMAVVPLPDAVALCERGKARVVSAHRLHWFCLRVESAISRNIVQLQKKISLLEKELQLYEKGFFKEYGLNAMQRLHSNADFLFKRTKLQFYSQLVAAIPLHLKSKGSVLFSKRLSDAVNAVESMILSNFKAFTQESGSRVVLLDGNAMVKSDTPLSLIEQFSRLQRIPARIKPKIGQKR